MCVGRSCVGLLGWDKTRAAVASGCARVSAVPALQGGQGETARAEERLRETLRPHRSNISFCNRRCPGWPEPVLAGGKVERDWQSALLPPGPLPAGHLQAMAMLRCPHAQGRRAEGPESVLEMWVGWWYPTPALVLARLPSHQQLQELINGGSGK